MYRTVLLNALWESLADQGVYLTNEQVNEVADHVLDRLDAYEETTNDNLAEVEPDLDDYL
jgi:hypothetical protein